MAASISFRGANSGLQAGIINGPVNPEFHQHLAPERAETPPNPSPVIPFGRDVDFVERGTILDELRSRCAVPGSRTALVGLGGVGKSQLAIEYAYRNHERTPDTWIFWVHASNAARFEQGYRDIASCVKIAGRQNPKANIFQLVHDWLRDEGKGRWLLILDNVDDAGFLFEAHSQSQARETKRNVDVRPLVSYLPRCTNGSILITTRSQEAALKMVELRDIVAINPMSELDALALLEKKLREYNDSDHAGELAAALEFMPLAIVQSAAYISQRAPRCSVRQYLEEFRKGDRKRARLLNFEGGQLRRDVEAKNSIIITWQISFDHIRRIRPSAADLLSLMSFFDRQGIPESLLQRRQKTAEKPRYDEERTGDVNKVQNDDSDNSTDDERSRNSDDALEDDIAMLRNYMFIAATTTRVGFEMHSLVQLATQQWLEAHGQHEWWKQQSISNLSSRFPNGEYGTWDICQRLFAHVKLVAAKKPQDRESLTEWTSLLSRAVLYCLYIGNWVDAETMSVQCATVRKKLLGADHPLTLTSMANLASTYWNQGRWDAAEELEVQVMETRKTKLGADHPSTLSSMANLASTYRNQGRWDVAEELFVQVIETSKTKLGVDHPDTLTSMANLASTYWNQGRWDAAEELEAQVMETFKRKLGVDHPLTLTSMGNLASIYQKQGRWDAAGELFVQVMEMSKRKLGVDHPDTMTSMGNLASIYTDQGQWDVAEELFVQVTETSKTKLGADHPDTLTSMSNLASTYQKQGRWDAAEDLFIQVIETSKTKLGVDHPDTLTNMANLASIYQKQGRWDAAEELFVQVIETSKTKLGVDHPDTLTSMSNLASIYTDQGQWDLAEELFVQVIETSKTKLGADHPDTLTSMANLASTYWNQGRWDAAEELEVQVMETSKRKLGADHPSTLTSMANLAFTFKSQCRDTEAIALMTECLSRRQRVLGESHPDSESSSKALLQWKEKQGKKAAPFVWLRQLRDKTFRRRR